MSLLYTLTTPITVGDMQHQTTISSLKLVSVSLNFEDYYTEQGHAVLSICLAEATNGYPVNVMYQDASALTMAKIIEDQIGQEIFDKLVADSRLPAGNVSTIVEPNSEI